MKNAIEVRGTEETLRKPQRAERGGSDHSQGRDFRAAGSQRRRKNHYAGMYGRIEERMTAGRLPWTEGPAFSFRPLLCRNT